MNGYLRNVRLYLFAFLLFTRSYDARYSRDIHYYLAVNDVSRAVLAAYTRIYHDVYNLLFISIRRPLFGD